MDEKVRGQILRSKINWHENGEKSSKFFLNLEKKKGLKEPLKLCVLIPKIKLQLRQTLCHRLEASTQIYFKENPKNL